MRVFAAGVTTWLLVMLAPAAVLAETETTADADQRVWMALQQAPDARPSFDVRFFTLTGQRDDAKFCRTPAAAALPAPGAGPAELARFAQQFGGAEARADVQRYLYAEGSGRVRILSTLATSSKPIFAAVEARPAPGTPGGFEAFVQVRPLANLRPNPRSSLMTPGRTLYAAARPHRRSRECVVVAATLLDAAQSEAASDAAAAQTKPFLSAVAEHERPPKILREGWRPSHAPLAGPVEVVYLATISPGGKTVWTQVVSATPGADPSILEAALYEEHTRSYRPATRDGRPVTAYGVRSVALHPGRWIIGFSDSSGAAALAPPQAVRPRRP